MEEKIEHLEQENAYLRSLLEKIISKLTICLSLSMRSRSQSSMYAFSIRIFVEERTYMPKDQENQIRKPENSYTILNAPISGKKGSVQENGEETSAARTAAINTISS